MNINTFNDFVSKIHENSLPGINSAIQLTPSVRNSQINSINANPTKAAVVICCYTNTNNEITFPLIKRQTYTGIHSAQISLPGGKEDSLDQNLWDTAKRELNEELGVDLRKLNKLYKLSQLFIPPSNFIVTPYLAYNSSLPKFIINKREVSEIINVTIDQLVDLKKTNRKISNSYLKDYSVPGYIIKKHFVWGATAMILKEFKVLLNSYIFK
jgi:8-oxo-dGTP pyrophosphatase MutT (NUDIX family)